MDVINSLRSTEVQRNHAATLHPTIVRHPSNAPCDSPANSSDGLHLVPSSFFFLVVRPGATSSVLALLHTCLQFRASITLPHMA